MSERAAKSERTEKLVADANSRRESGILFCGIAGRNRWCRGVVDARSIIATPAVVTRAGLDAKGLDRCKNGLNESSAHNLRSTRVARTGHRSGSVIDIFVELANHVPEISAQREELKDSQTARPLERAAEVMTRNMLRDVRTFGSAGRIDD